jgi:uncharacterized protein (DUF1810 family)
VWGRSLTKAAQLGFLVENRSFEDVFGSTSQVYHSFSTVQQTVSHLKELQGFLHLKIKYVFGDPTKTERFNSLTAFRLAA